MYNDVGLYSTVHFVCLFVSADRLRVNTTKTIHFGRMHLHEISFGTPQVIFHLGRLKFKSVPPPWGLKMAFYAPLIREVLRLENFVILLNN